MSPITHNPPDISKALPDSDMNTWERIDPSHGPQSAWKNESGFAIYRAAFTPPKFLQRSGGRIVFHSIAGTAQFYLNDGLAGAKQERAAARMEISLPPGSGKIALSVARGTPVPPGWIIDSDGKPTTDPSQLRQGGALLPVGGTEGYKGYGLSVMVEILCGLLTGLGFGVEPTGRHNDGCFMAVFKVDAFRPLAEFKKNIGEFVQYLKATKPAEGSSGVYYPGEIEHMREEDRRSNGIEIEDATWYKLRTLAEGYGIADELGFAEIE